jgi:hypothetical protein
MPAHQGQVNPALNRGPGVHTAPGLFQMGPTGRLRFEVRSSQRSFTATKAGHFGKELMKLRHAQVVVFL